MKNNYIVKHDQSQLISEVTWHVLLSEMIHNVSVILWGQERDTLWNREAKQNRNLGHDIDVT